MASGGAGDTAGGMKVQFSATGQQNVKAAAEQVRQSLHQAGDAGRKSGEDIAEGAKHGEEGIGGMAKEAGHFAHTIAKLGGLIALVHLIHLIKEIADGWIEAAKRAEEYNQKLNEMAREGANKLRDMGATPEERERNALLDEYKANTEKINKALEEQKKSHEGIWASTLGYYVERKKVEELEEQAHLALQNELILLDKKTAILDAEAAKKNKAANDEYKRAQVQMEEKLTAENRVKGLELIDDKMDAIWEAARLQTAELEKQKRWAESYPALLAAINERQRQINAQADKDVAEYKATQEKERQAVLSKQAAELERERMEIARDRLRFEEEITKNLNEQVGAFNLANASFSSAQAAGAGAFGQQWSIASRVGR